MPLLAGVHFENRFYYVIDVALGIDTARNGQTQQLVARGLTEHDRAVSHGADAGVPVKLDGQGLAGELVRRNVRHMRAASI